MWHGVEAYLGVVALVALILHGLTRRYLGASLAGAAFCSIANMVHEAWLAGFEVNPGWAPVMFFAGMLLALPVCLAVGLPFVWWRQYRSRPKNEAAQSGLPGR
jgi:hypothetical protein